MEEQTRVHTRLLTAKRAREHATKCTEMEHYKTTLCTIAGLNTATEMEHNNTTMNSLISGLNTEIEHNKTTLHNPGAEHGHEQRRRQGGNKIIVRDSARAITSAVVWELD